jgi:hypothetical protein
MVDVYDEKGVRLTSIPSGDGLHGYTSTTVSVKRGSMIETFNEKGVRLSSVPAR